MDAYATSLYATANMSIPRIIPYPLLPCHALQLNLTHRPITPYASYPQQEVIPHAFRIPSSCFRHPYAAFSFVEDVMLFLGIHISLSDVSALESCISGLDPDMGDGPVAVVASVEVLLVSDEIVILDAVGSGSVSAGFVCKDLLKKVKYERSDNEDEACPICLKEFKDGRSVASTPCSHLFHGKCIKNWIKKKQEDACCPLCRAQIIVKS